MAQDAFRTHYVEAYQITQSSAISEQSELVPFDELKKDLSQLPLDVKIVIPDVDNTGRTVRQWIDQLVERMKPPNINSDSYAPYVQFFENFFKTVPAFTSSGITCQPSLRILSVAASQLPGLTRELHEISWWQQGLAQSPPIQPNLNV